MVEEEEEDREGRGENGGDEKRMQNGLKRNKLGVYIRSSTNETTELQTLGTLKGVSEVCTYERRLMYSVLVDDIVTHKHMRESRKSTRAKTLHPN